MKRTRASKGGTRRGPPKTTRQSDGASVSDQKLVLADWLLPGRTEADLRREGFGVPPPRSVRPLTRISLTSHLSGAPMPVGSN